MTPNATGQGIQASARRYDANRQAAVWASAAFLALGGAVVLLSFWALDPARRLTYLSDSAADFIGREEWRQAALQLGNVVQVAPDDSVSWRELGLVQLREAAQTGDESLVIDSLRSLRRASELAPADHVPLRWLLEVELRSGNLDEARIHAARLAELAPKHPLVVAAWDALPSASQREIAQLCLQLDSPEGAERIAGFCRDRFAADDAVRDSELARLFATALTRLHRYSERDRFLADIESRYPGSQRSVCLRAECALLDGDVAAAAYAASRCKSGPMAPVAHALATEAYLRWAELEPSERAVHLASALDQLKRILNLAPNEGAEAAEAARIEGEEFGRVEAALTIATDALARIAEPPAALLEVRGRLLAKSGRLDEALACLQRAATASPSMRTWKSFERIAWKKSVDENRRRNRKPLESAGTDAGSVKEHP